MGDIVENDVSHGSFRLVDDVLLWPFLFACRFCLLEPANFLEEAIAA